MSTHQDTSASSAGPLSLDALFEAHLSAPDESQDLPASTAPAEPVASPEHAGSWPSSAQSFPTPATSDTPEDPADVDHDEEADDIDTAAALGLTENDPESSTGSDEEAQDTALSDDGLATTREDLTFTDLGLPADLLKAVTDMGYTTPTPIQREAIPVLLGGRDVVGVAQTGTGKTAAFGLPLLDAVEPRDSSVQALVLAPTRELALQSADAITDMAQRSRGLDVVAVYGGAPYGPQIGALKGGAQVVVGTPGRVIDLIEKGALRLEDVRFFVLDEADEMLRMGFAEDVETIAASLPTQRRTALFSATMPPAIQAVARQHLTDPQRIEVSRQSSTVDTVHQTYAVVPFRHKIGAVSRVLAVTEAQAAIVFVRTKSTAEDVAIELASRGIQAAAISGDVPQRERERLVERLRAGSLDVLVATDVAARGLDVDRIGLVVNFDVPREAEAYVHRIGRTGRAGRHGEAVTFLTPKEKNKLRQIERLTGTRLEEITLPSPADVSRHRAAALLGRASARHERGRLDLYTDLVDATCHDMAVGPEVLAATLLALAVGDEGPRTWQERKEEPRVRVRREENLDSEGTFVSASFEGGRERAPRKDRGARGVDRFEGKPGASRGGRRHEDGSGTVYRVEVGRRDRVLPGAIVGALANEGGISGSDIGKIDILQSFSLVEIHTPLTPEQLKAMSRATFGGRELRIRPDQGPGHGWEGPDDNPPSERAQRRAGRPFEQRAGGRGFRSQRDDRDERSSRGRGAYDRGGRDSRDGRDRRDGGRQERRAPFAGESGERRGWRGHQDRRGSYDQRGRGDRGGWRGREGRGGQSGGRSDRDRW